jgi:hypothetical protein
MQESYDAIKLAVRVLEALTEQRYPYHGDIAALRAIAGPQAQNVTDDELACKVIHDALDRRAAVRSKANGTNSRSERPPSHSHL